MRRGTCDSVAGRLIEPSPRAERLDAQGFNDESGLAPPLEPPAQRVEILVTVGAQEEGHPGARRLSRLRTVKDHLAAQAAWEWPELAARPARQGPAEEHRHTVLHEEIGYRHVDQGLPPRPSSARCRTRTSRITTATMIAVDQPKASVPLTASSGPKRRERGDMTMSP